MTWLQRMLVAQGHMTESGLSRRARVRRCRHCQRMCIAGMDGDVLAFETWTDIDPVTAAGEVFALLEGRRTFDLWGPADRQVLEVRRAAHIAKVPAGSDRPVLVEHRCETPLPAAWVVPFVPAEATPPAPDDVPPF